ncbi:dihydroxyacetone kinase phosphoryl donor subunit DhaM [Lacisediminihabitans profunda]|uniref:Phosphocarrier protein HPr n=1 Tax=Lacisediminihabitans profunda TaxID=2594790 RepID=A0A5C8UV14_9MICO|nr:dihydroxyacetone kinase phosphoryl donor subunit DhaM [Lacisediminihabitans profunda]TXN31839.1 HPr family phosphocarrier protein [Lacisediminihabitans profunda]
MAKVGIVVVSHSDKIATGLVELAGQMAATTTIRGAGGTDYGGIGTSFDKVTEAIASADSGAGVVILCDLGSAVLTAETALEFLDDEVRSRVRIADAPLVEGAVAAAVAAESGESLAAVFAAAESANSAHEPRSAPSAPASSEPPAAGADAPVSAHAVLVNKDGLHARPAAEFVKLASTFDARVTVNGVDAKSLLRIMSLGLAMGSEVTIEATGTDARKAVDGLNALVLSGFGE